MSSLNTFLEVPSISALPLFFFGITATIYVCTLRYFFLYTPSNFLDGRMSLSNVEMSNLYPSWLVKNSYSKTVLITILAVITLLVYSFETAWKDSPIADISCSIEANSIVWWANAALLVHTVVILFCMVILFGRWV